MSQLNAAFLGKYIDVSLYPELYSAIPDDRIVIVELIDDSELNYVLSRYLPFLGGVDVVPAAVTLGDEMIFIGSGSNNDGYVYYVDIEFGIFKLHNSVDEFLNAIKL